MRPGRIAVAMMAALAVLLPGVLLPAAGRAAAPSIKEISIGLFPALRPLELVRGMRC